jgi:hypothetical protein
LSLQAMGAHADPGKAGNMPHWRRLPRLLKAAMHGVYAACVSLALLLPAGKYAWIQEMDASAPPGAFADASGNGRLSIAVLLLAAIVVQAVLALAVGNRKERRISLALAALAACFLVAKLQPIYSVLGKHDGF